jgi:hypothetical protein
MAIEGLHFPIFSFSKYREEVFNSSPLKFLVFSGPNSTIFDIVGKINFSKNKVWDLKKVTVGSWSYLVIDQPQKIAAPHSMGARRL